jgi:GDP-mannose 6-dehydrogenase
MKISVLGLGYVGAVSAACLAKQGHHVTGVDIDAVKVELVNAGRSPIVEAGLEDIIAEQTAARRLCATLDAEAAVVDADAVLVCVATPSQPSGAIDLEHVRRVCEQIGEALRSHPGAPVVALRSSVLPGTVRGLVVPTLERCSGRRAGADFGVCFNPEFMREGSAVHDFFNPPKTVIGELTRTSGAALAELYEGLPGALLRVDLETAEMVKYVDNGWHALKVGFANEIGTLCRALQVDPHRVMELFARDTKLNISPAYLKPGFAFGGSCLPKDLRALLHRARALDERLPILGAVLPSNELQIERALRAVAQQGHRKVGLLGLAFKAGTDDLRESPLVELAERLLGKGYELRIYDRCVNLARVRGANRFYALGRIPHLQRLMVSSLVDALAHADTVVIGNAAPEFRDLAARIPAGKAVIDLTRHFELRPARVLAEGTP